MLACAIAPVASSCVHRVQAPLDVTVIDTAYPNSVSPSVDTSKLADARVGASPSENHYISRVLCPSYIRYLADILDLQTFLRFASLSIFDTDSRSKYVTFFHPALHSGRRASERKQQGWGIPAEIRRDFGHSLLEGVVSAALLPPDAGSILCNFAALW